MAKLADRIMDKVVYSIIFPLVAVGTMWRIHIISPGPNRAELLHAILVLLLTVIVLVRDNFAHFMRGFAIRNDQVQLAWFGGLSGVRARLLVPDSEAIAQGYEDLNDHETVRTDPAIQTAVDRDTELGSQATLCRLEQRSDRKAAVA